MERSFKKISMRDYCLLLMQAEFKMEEELQIKVCLRKTSEKATEVAKVLIKV